VASSASTGTHTLDGQVTWLNLAVFSLSIGLGADAALFFTARRASGRRRPRVYPTIQAGRSNTLPAGKDAPWVWLAGSGFAHRAKCPMGREKVTIPAGAELIRREGLMRCEC
jgi:hypothetical protein